MQAIYQRYGGWRARTRSALVSVAAVAAGARASGAAVLEPSSRGIKSSNDERGARLLDSWACEELHELRVRHDESDKVLDGAVEHVLEDARLFVPLVVAAVAGHSSRERLFEEQCPLLVVKADDATDVGLKGEAGLGREVPNLPGKGQWRRDRGAARGILLIPPVPRATGSWRRPWPRGPRTCRTSRQREGDCRLPRRHGGRRTGRPSPLARSAAAQVSDRTRTEGPPSCR